MEQKDADKVKKSNAANAMEKGGVMIFPRLLVK